MVFFRSWVPVHGICRSLKLNGRHTALQDAFADFATLTVQGNFIAGGTAEAPIFFTSASGVGLASPWRANGQGEGNDLPGSRLSYCTFEGGEQ